MKESEAWQILAEEHDAERTGSEFLCLNLSGLRRNVNPATLLIPGDVADAMVERVRDALPPDEDTAYPEFELDCPDVRPARVLACLMFAEQAKDEEAAQ
jgi:hypothetical protein